MDFLNTHRQTIEKVLFITATVALLYLFFNVVYSYVAPFIWGFILSLILRPMIGFITNNSKIPRGIATVFSLLIFILVVGLIFNVVISQILREGRSFFEYLPQTLESVSAALTGFMERFDGIYEFIPTAQQETFSEIVGNIISAITSAAGSAVGDLSGIVVKIPNALLSVLLAIISAFFFAKDQELISAALKKLTPKPFRTHTVVLKEGIVSGVMGYIKAQCILMSIVAVICVTGLLILDAPYALFLGVIIAIVDALPVFGSGFFYWPWMAFSMITGDYPMAIGLGIIYLSIMITRQVLEPKILGVQIGVHPLITLMSIYIGLRIFGFFGIFIGPCIAIVIKAVYEMPGGKIAVR